MQTRHVARALQVQCARIVRCGEDPTAWHPVATGARLHHVDLQREVVDDVSFTSTLDVRASVSFDGAWRVEVVFGMRVGNELPDSRERVVLLEGVVLPYQSGSTHLLEPARGALNFAFHCWLQQQIRNCETAPRSR
jgi:hypothetical protein